MVASWSVLLVSFYSKLTITANKFSSSISSNVALASVSDNAEKIIAANICRDLPMKIPGMMPMANAIILHEN